MARNFVAASTQYITIDSSTATYSFMQNTAVFTVSAMVKLDNTSADAAYAICGSGGGASSQKGFTLTWDNRSAFLFTKQVRVFLGRGLVDNYVFAYNSNNNAITDTNWHNVIVTSDGSNSYLYVDNVQVGSAAVATLSSGDSTNNMQIGSVGTNVIPFNGDIAEMAFWTVALNPDERAALSKGAKPSRVRPQSLAMYAPLVNTLFDYDTAKSMTNTGTTVSNHPRVY